MIHCAIDSGGEARPTVHRTRPGDPAVTIFIRSINSSGLLRYSAAVWNVIKATPMAMYAQTFHKSQRPERPKINPPGTTPKTATIATTFRTRFFMIGPPSALGSMANEISPGLRKTGMLACLVEVKRSFRNALQAGALTLERSQPPAIASARRLAELVVGLGSPGSRGSATSCATHAAST